MSRTLWLTLFCSVGLAPAIAIKVAAPPASLVAESTGHQSKIEPASAPNESSKSDRLELPNARAETKTIVPPAEPMPLETPSTSLGTIKKVADRHWQDANARVAVVEPHRRHAKSKESKKSAGTPPPNERAEAWHCRQDAMGSLLRSLDLSPRCSL
jgi:hypothetical protein